MSVGRATRGLCFDEPPIFAESTPGRSGASLPKLDVPEVSLDSVWPQELHRAEQPALPEVSEPQVVRHYTRLSQWNYSIDTGMYPLGSCTMKHNPKLADKAVGLPAFANLHPYQPDEQLQGALALLWELEQMLATVGGFSRVTLQPAAGAHGELCGLMMIRAFHQDRKQTRTKVLIPDSAHGTNPASCTLNGFVPVPLETSDDGTLSIDAVAAAIDGDLAGIMVTNPSTLGLFETHFGEIAELVRKAGGCVYMDGANLNAIMGKFRPGDAGVDAMHFNLHKTFGTPHGGGGPGAGPVGVSERLAPFLPVPTVEKRDDDGFFLQYDRPQTVGRLRSFVGNFGVLLRAYVYMREYGADLERVTELAVLNANYLRVSLKNVLHIPYPDHCMHEVVANDHDLKQTSVTTMDIAKRLIDYGFHPPTVYFPLIVHGALMIEPTETESPEELDRFIEALRNIVSEAKEQPEKLTNAPRLAFRRRLDEAQAARKPKLRY
jgi:glycine dehydrogenase subunit 2